MDEEEIRDDSLTESEAEEVESGEMDAEESHRYEEFRELNEKLDRALEVLDAIRGEMNDQAAMAIENGAIVTDADPVQVEVEVEDPEFETDMNKWDWD